MVPSPEQWRRIEDLFQAALDLPPGERTAFLMEQSGADTNLRQAVQNLIARYDEAGTRFDSPALGRAESIATLHQYLEEYNHDYEATGDRIGPYRIEREIGRGGMGTVYQAARDDGAFEQSVAVKLVRRGLDSGEILERFRRERQILALLNHPNIARMLDGGSAPDGRPYFVMELIDGKTLMEYCSSVRLSLEKRLDLFAAICSAVAHAHQNLVIHRDLKPANILVTSDGAAKLLDFGIAKMWQPEFADPSLTRAAARMLTPDYASPEQVRGDPVTTATDVYALGLILFELLTGRRAQRATSAAPSDIERAVCITETPRPSSVEIEGAIHTANRLRGDLDTIVLKCLQKDPLRRYQTVTQLAEDIARYRAGRPVLARPDSFSYRASKFLSRNRYAVAAVAAILVAIGGGVYSTVRQANIAREHFNSVRSLSKSLINEIDAATVAVPGTTKARHLIVLRSLEYLDRLSRNSSGDLDLMLEMGEAYASIGTIQGNRNRSNLGDYEGAMVSYRKALELFRQIAVKRPGSLGEAKIALVGSEAARVFPESAESAVLAKEALEVAERMERRDPGKQDLALANAYFSLAYLHTVREEPDEAIPQFERTRELFVKLKRSVNNLAVCDRYIAINLVKKGEAGKARDYVLRALELDQSHSAKTATGRARMDLTYDYIGMARVDRAAGSYEDALEWVDRAEKARRELAAADSTDKRPKLALIETDHMRGAILSDAGRLIEGRYYLERARKAAESVAGADPGNLEDAVELAGMHLDLARNRTRAGDCTAARASWDKARQLFLRYSQQISLRELDQIPACVAK